MSSPENKLQKDFSDLARVALTGRTQDVQVLLQRAIKRHRDQLPGLTDKLMELLRESPTRSSPLRKQASLSLPVDADSRLHLIRVEDNPELSHEPVYSEKIRTVLDRVVAERHRIEALLKAGVEPTRTVIFTGPPGVGKTLTARWLAIQLKRPLIILDLAAVMSSYLGRTGGNLRQVLDFAKSVDCVLLLDELDAIAKRRDDNSEVGELKRLVTVLIQEIDDWPATGLLLAATNHAELLDPAIWRRFDERVEFSLPNSEAIQNFVMAQLSEESVDAKLWSRILSLSFKKSSFSDVERALKNARRGAALNGGDLHKHLLSVVKSEGLDKGELISLATELVHSKLMTQRSAHELTGVARDTIRAHMHDRQNSEGAQ
ncbi:AAA family ATPase [Hyphomonas johnsonii]|uniref:ATPase AAA n=1 Tax=Hyphomonas johnsonii MHS-2 TaxID=1280950 RepID=A0A059FSZ6_9PROT|nr:ATP-binding protein [Hyphomonas johnsonii]KCZ93820.1 ATPase AAA [Hyphomonas johnsonii MHS-2]